MFSLSDGGSQQTYYRILYTCWFLYKHETEKKVDQRYGDAFIEKITVRILSLKNKNYINQLSEKDYS